MNFINSIAKNSNFAFFLRIFDEMLSGFRAKSQKIVMCVAFSSNLRKQIRNLPKILNFVKIIQYYSKLFTGVLRNACHPRRGPDHRGHPREGQCKEQRRDGDQALPRTQSPMGQRDAPLSS